MAEQAEKSPETFLRSFAEPLIVDEVQYAPSLFRHLKAGIDQAKRPGRFILTGSQSFALMHGISESLAGRCGVLSIQNLSARELMDSLHGFDEIAYIFKGGYPELYDNPAIDPHFWFGAYFSTYLERDVRNILNVGSLRDFDRFLRAVAVRTGQILSYSDLARDVGIAPNNAKQWISVLQASGQIVLLEPYHRDLGKRLVKSPKLYLSDTGIAAFLMGFDKAENLLRHPVIGALWETHVVMQVVKHFASRVQTIPMWFWRTGQDAEVDLLVEHGGRFVAIEAKFSETPDHTSLRGFDSLRKFYGEGCITAAYVASRTQRSFPLSDLVQVVPGSRIDSYLV